MLVRRPEGGWRLYVSCATPDSKHWWIEAVDADEPAGLETGTRTVVLPGSDDVAVKDPVVLVDESGWRMWVCVHPLAEPGHEDRMTTAYATSSDGLVWDWHGTVLSPTDGTWDQRGTRVSAVLSESPLVVLYDGRAHAEDNWHEVTGPRPSHRRPHARGRGRAGDPVTAQRRRAALRRGRAAAGRQHPVLLRGRAAGRGPRPDDQRQPLTFCDWRVWNESPGRGARASRRRTRR